MGLPTDKCTVVPVLVLQDHILRVPFLNCYLNKRFEEKLDRHIFRPDIVVRPLSVVNIHELKTMVESAEASGFDFVYALHHRAVRDEEMLSNLQEFLMQFPQYGKERSARAIRVYDELQETMFSWLFPDEAAEHELARTSKHLAGCRLKNALPSGTQPAPSGGQVDW